MLEQGYGHPSRGAQGLPGLAEREGLGQPRQHPHGPGGTVRQEHHRVAQAQQPAGPLGGGQLARTQPEGGQVVRLRSGEGVLVGINKYLPQGGANLPEALFEPLPEGY